MASGMNTINVGGQWAEVIQSVSGNQPSDGKSLRVSTGASTHFAHWKQPISALRNSGKLSGIGMKTRLISNSGFKGFSSANNLSSCFPLLYSVTS